MSDKATTTMLATAEELLTEATLTPEEWEFVQETMASSRGEGELLLSLLRKAKAAGEVEEARSRM